ncbi:hypothetical protein P7C73_g2628, partial [Tremellales sp. Uapishka_1]
MDDLEDESEFGALGLQSILAQAGIDSNAVSSFLDKEGHSSRELREIDVEAPEKYEDDVSEGELPEEDAADVRARQIEDAKRKKEEERYIRIAYEQHRKENSAVTMAERARRKKDMEGSEMDQVKRIWPEFAKGERLRMSEVFYETPAQKKGYEMGLVRKKRRKLNQREEHQIQLAPNPPTSPISTFLLPTLAPLPVHNSNRPFFTTRLGASYFDKQWIKDAKQKYRQTMTEPPPGLSLDLSRLSKDKGNLLDLLDWEDSVVFCSLDRKGNKPFEPLAPRNTLLESGAWLKDVIWDATKVNPVVFDDDDDDEEDVSKGKKSDNAVASTSKLDPFNISNDHLYEHTREARFRIRQTFGTIEVHHSIPAKTLQMPFYKTMLSKTDARAWHRPALQFPTGVPISFSKLKSNPSYSSSKKKQLMTDPAERFKSTKDLTLAEKGPFVLLEFSEEYPPIMSNYGMGTTIVNYYRKKDDKDEFVPKLDLGQPSILNVGDAEPYLLGYVDPGKVTQTLHNNLIRAPIFRHTPESTDFLVIRQTVNGNPTYHLREIKNLFTVGQTVPNESEVPGPHARKNTNTAKLRLMIVAWLLVQKSKAKRLKFSKLMKYFPDQTELQMRQRLKIKGNEFMYYVRHPDPDQGFWKLDPSYTDFPTDRKAVSEHLTPEHAVLYEAMQVGARHLHDAGYSKTAEGNAEEEIGDDPDAGLDIEQQLAVWETTLNYKKAEAQKAWLVVHGEGDPTGRGEGFSFLKTNMKSYFLRKGETEDGRRQEAFKKANGNPVKVSNAEQQRIYEEEKRKVWDLQASALSNPVAPELVPTDELQVASTPLGLGPRFHRGDSARRGASRANSVMYDSPMDEGMSPGGFSGDGDSTFTGHERNQGKVMRITRIVKGRPQTDIVRDQAVIASYLRRVEERKLDYYLQHPELLQPTGDAEEDAVKMTALKMELDKTMKNRQRRLARKGLEGEDGMEPRTGKRKCGACGEIGHTKTNRNCPLFNRTSIGPSPAGTPGGPTPSGYGGYGSMDAMLGLGHDAPQAGPSTKIRLAMPSQR